MDFIRLYIAEATTILTFMTGAEEIFVWDEHRKTTLKYPYTNECVLFIKSGRLSAPY